MSRRPTLAPSTARLALRLTGAERAEWASAAQADGRSVSEMVRRAVAAWRTIAERADALGVDGAELLDEALEDHARVGAVVDRLTDVAEQRALTPEEMAILGEVDPVVASVVRRSRQRSG